ncbi:MAG TPA: V-type ATPase 116kDa subunit family protein [Candidatus Acidoferrales bacterium]|nr:V-type ATPase 116kDa subunit family protein [Candidatus Acidoferrales bacterium]
MLHTEPMQKIRILSLESKKYSVVKELQMLGTIDISKGSLEINDDSTSELLPRISDMLVKFNSVLSVLKAPKTKEARQLKHLDVEELLKRCEGFNAANEAFTLSGQKKSLSDRIRNIDDTLEIAEMFSGTGIDFGKLHSGVLDFKAIKIERKYSKRFKGLLKDTKVRYELIAKELKDKEWLFFIAYPKQRSQVIEAAVKAVKHIEINLAGGKLDSTPSEMRARLDKEKEEIRATMKGIDAKIAEVSANNYFEVAALTEMLEIEFERASISSKFKRTQRVFVVDGWIPKKKLGEIKAAVAKCTENMYQFDEIKTKELAPTYTERPKILSPFGFILNFYSVPRSDEIDPTWIFIVSFIIFYGMMVSDVGYGLISLLIAMLIARKTDPDGLMHNVAKIWQISSISIIFFGVISNQYLGFSIPFLNALKIFDWTKDTVNIILITAFIGIAQVVLGQMFSFINKMRHHETKLAISKITAIIAILSGVVAIGGLLFHAFGNTLSTAAAIVSIITFVTTGALSGIEASELTNLITHPLSYTRILGFGLASVIIAYLIDNAFTPTMAHGILVFIAFLVIFIILHLLNMLLGIFEGIIQSIRLNFVEFFSKFYTGNGIRFRPYYFRRRYTKD